MVVLLGKAPPAASFSGPFLHRVFDRELDVGRQCVRIAWNDLQSPDLLPEPFRPVDEIVGWPACSNFAGHHCIEQRTLRAIQVVWEFMLDVMLQQHPWRSPFRI